MTQEEKAKRYDEAIERARYWEKNPTVWSSGDICQKLFPELKGSDDERIRKRLINYFYGFLDGYEDTYKVGGCVKWEGLDVKDVIAWLEKQGEQNLDTDFSDLRTWKYIVDAVCTEKEGIGQYLDNPFTEEVAKKLQKRFGNIKQKPAWSEEDEFELENVLCHLRNYLHKDSYIRYENWLKSLKDRIQLKPKWNPSDEQMVALDGICSYIRNKADWEISQDMVSDLYKLSEQLKKLKD